jgi:hypothetical protein
MANRQSKRRSRAQKRRRHSMRGGRREETKPVVEEEKKEEAPTEGGLFGLFSGDAKKDDATAEETAAPIEETAAPVEGAAAPIEETAAPAPTEGADAVPTEGATKKKGKKRRHGKYYTPKQLKEACKRLSSKKRQHKNRPFPRERRGPMMMDQTSNPYAFGERPMM